MVKNFQFVRGDTFSFGVGLIGLGEQDLDSAYFTVKDSFDGENIIQKSLGSGISKVEDEKYVVRVAPEDTEETGVTAGQYYYDMEISVNGDTFTILHGILTIENDVTREVE